MFARNIPWGFGRAGIELYFLVVVMGRSGAGGGGGGRVALVKQAAQLRLDGKTTHASRHFPSCCRRQEPVPPQGWQVVNT